MGPFLTSTHEVGMKPFKNLCCSLNKVELTNKNLICYHAQGLIFTAVGVFVSTGYLNNLGISLLILAVKLGFSLRAAYEISVCMSSNSYEVWNK